MMQDKFLYALPEAVVENVELNISDIRNKLK
jgi:hypothetical protein